MDNDNPFVGVLAILMIVIIGVIIALVTVYPEAAIRNRMNAPGQFATIEALRRDVRYYEKVKECIPANIVRDVENWNQLIMSNRNPGKFVDPVIPDSWKKVEPIEISQNIKLCN